MRTKSWTLEQLQQAVLISFSIRQVLKHLNLKPAGGNYAQIKKYFILYKLNTSHFTGKLWNKGLRGIGKPRLTLEAILVRGSTFQSYKLKKRLFANKLKESRCELCGWAEKSNDGRIPLELDHKNGIANDNRIENLSILCPNCHSLQITHRGKNKHKAQWRNWYTRST